MKVSELAKILKKNGCYLVEHGKEHDKWHSDATAEISWFRGMEAKRQQPE